MNTLQRYLPTIIRLALSLLSGILASHGFDELNLETDSAFQILTALAVIGLVALLKWADATENKWLSLIVGPRVQYVAISIARTVLSVITGFLVGTVDQSNIEHANAYELIMILATTAINLTSKKAKP